jgi:hypothetical protein
LDQVFGLLVLAVYIAGIVGLAALVTWGVIKIFPTERTPRKPDEPGKEKPASNGGGATSGGGRLFRRAKRGTA